MVASPAQVQPSAARRGRGDPRRVSTAVASNLSSRPSSTSPSSGVDTNAACAEPPLIVGRRVSTPAANAIPSIDPSATERHVDRGGDEPGRVGGAASSSTVARGRVTPATRRLLRCASRSASCCASVERRRTSRSRRTADPTGGCAASCAILASSAPIWSRRCVMVASIRVSASDCPLISWRVFTSEAAREFAIRAAAVGLSAVADSSTMPELPSEDTATSSRANTTGSAVTCANSSASWIAPGPSRSRETCPRSPSPPIRSSGPACRGPRAWMPCSSVQRWR